MVYRYALFQWKAHTWHLCMFRCAIASYALATCNIEKPQFWKRAAPVFDLSRIFLINLSFSNCAIGTYSYLKSIEMKYYWEKCIVSAHCAISCIKIFMKKHIRCVIYSTYRYFLEKLWFFSILMLRMVVFSSGIYCKIMLSILFWGVCIPFAFAEL